VSIGHRRKIMRAIREFAASPVLAVTERPASAAAVTQTTPSDTAERRQVTVTFSDLVGSTALSARMDPEDLREVIAAYQKCVAETVQRFGGFVANYMGDGVLVYFGYPQAHEDDAERAVRAGLELIAAISALKAPVSLQTRVGIATGLVVVGDLIGSGEAQERGIVGDTPNLAARLQGIAEPNTMVIADGTRKLLGNSLRTRRPRIKRPQGHHRPSASVGGAAGEFGGKPLRGAAHKRLDCARWAGRGTRIAAAALGASEERRRSSGVALGRGRYRQIAAHGGAAGAPHERAAHALAVFLLAAARRQYLLSDHPPDGTCRWN
jgi:class 3 adenylate cyclase